MNLTLDRNRFLTLELTLKNGLSSQLSTNSPRSRYVLLVRWDSLRLNATAMGKPWPLHDTKAEEFAAFATAYNASGITHFTETRKQADGHGHTYSSVPMTLASFHAELFG